MNVLSLKKNWLGSKKRQKFFNKIIKPWKRNTMKIIKNGQNFVIELVAKWKIMQMSIKPNFHWIHSKGIMFLRKAIVWSRN